MKGSEKMFKLPAISLALFVIYLTICKVAIKNKKRKSHSASGMALNENADIYSPIMPSGNTYYTALNEL